MKTRIVVDTALCQGYAQCEAVAPGLFRLDDDLVAIPLKEPETPEELALAEETVQRCPRQAIRLERGEPS